MAQLFRGAQHSKVYQKYRPGYPTAVYSAILKYFDAGKVRGADGDQLTRPPPSSNHRGTALDLGCGTGISTLPLCDHFKRVIGVDVSESQLEEARKAGAKHEGLSYRVGLAHDLSFQEDGSVDLITIAQALHWVDTKKFYPECNRILRPGGVIAAYGYGIPILNKPEAQSVLLHYHDDVLGEFWDSGRRHIADRYTELYKDFSTAFPGSERDDSLVLEKSYSMDDFNGYLQSWSAYQSYKSHSPNAQDHLHDICDSLLKILSVSDDAAAADGAKKSDDAGITKKFGDGAWSQIQFPVKSPIFILLARKAVS